MTKAEAPGESCCPFAEVEILPVHWHAFRGLPNAAPRTEMTVGARILLETSLRPLLRPS